MTKEEHNKSIIDNWMWIAQIRHIAEEKSRKNILTRIRYLMCENGTEIWMFVVCVVSICIFSFILYYLTSI